MRETVAFRLNSSQIALFPKLFEIFFVETYFYFSIKKKKNLIIIIININQDRDDRQNKIK